MTLPPTFAQIMKREAAERARARPITVRKDAPTFASLMARDEFRAWLPQALDALSGVITSAVYVEGDPSLTPEVRATALVTAVDAFRAQLLQRTAETIVAKHRGHRRWPGML